MNKTAAKAVGRKFGLPVFYSGIQERMRFIVRAARSLGCTPDLLSYALVGDGKAVDTGTNRNAISLQLAGQPWWTVDDDTLCNLRTLISPVPLNERLSSYEASDTNVETGDSVESALEENVDLFSVFDGLLGSDLRRLPNRGHSYAGSLGAVCVSSNEYIASVYTGVYGHSGCALPPLLAVRSGSRSENRARATPEFWRKHGVIHRESKRVLLTRSGPTMMTSVACDPSCAYTPFLPRFRAQDAVFAVTMSLCAPNALSAHLPISIQHDGFTNEYEQAGPLRVRVAEIVIAVLLSTRQRSPTNGSSAHDLGKALIELGCRSESEMLAQLMAIVRAWQANRVRNAMDLIRGQDIKGIEVDRLEKLLDRWARHARYREFRIKDLIPQHGRTAAQLRDCFQMFGYLLLAWSQVASFAAMLPIDQRLSEPIDIAVSDV